MARRRQVRKDNVIRKKLNQELGRKKPSTRAHRSTKPVQGTVGSLRPSQALTLLDSAMVVDAARIMAAKRADAVLVIDHDSTLVGIITDKDLAFRVVAEGLNIHITLISQVMTRNPFCVTTDTNATEALNKMTSGGFRHLPCLNAEGDIVGLLDITRCLYEALEKLEKAHRSSRQLVEALEGMQEKWAQTANPELRSYVDIMRDRMASPGLNVILDENHGVAEIRARTTVREASRIMKQVHATASLIVEDGRIAGIFTTKDIVVRVLAAGLEPDRTSIIRVMTHHPDTVKPSMTILGALKKMHDNHYLHLPVVDELGHMAGLVDVLQVSLAMLRQMNTIQSDCSSEGPVWNNFWESSFNREDTGSDISASDGRSVMVPASELHYGTVGMIGSGIKVGSALSSRAGEPGKGLSSPMSPISTSPVDIDPEFVFKFKSQTGQMHRFMSSSRSYKELYEKVADKMESGGQAKGRGVTLSYCDEENDQVLLLQDSDVVDAVRMAFRNRWLLIRLSVMVSPSENGSSNGSIINGSRNSTGLGGIGGSIPLVSGLDRVVLAGGIGVGLGMCLALVCTVLRK
ncbi:hypothetical protein BGZ54_003278 [Gamsiella multidivaricata]|nr:hypothetical protein BGZ54_003278 [Gamsiella multidivaricata]